MTSGVILLVGTKDAVPVRDSFCVRYRFGWLLYCAAQGRSTQSRLTPRLFIVRGWSHIDALRYLVVSQLPWAIRRQVHWCMQ